jgi:type I restriction enzyme S subunit
MQVKPGDILITRAGPVNRTGVACLVKEIHYNLILSDKTVRINMTDSHIDKDYVVMVLNSQQIRNFIINLMSGMDRQQVNISQEKFKTVLIPLPPLAEQKRIVAKLEELLSLCECLKR